MARPGFPALPTPPPIGTSASPGGPIAGDLTSMQPIVTAPGIESLPSAPPLVKAKRPGAFDADHRQDTFLAMAAALLGNQDFGPGAAGALSAILGQNANARKVDKPQLGGPDNAFEVYTDPNTGEHTFKPIKAVQDYQAGKRVKDKDVADMNGRVMYNIGQLSPEEQEHAFQDVRANPELYGIDLDRFPTSWDPRQAKVMANGGMTVSQALTRAQAVTNAENTEGHKTKADQDRAERTAIAKDRAGALTRQGDARIGQGAQRIAKMGAGKGSSAGHISGMSNADLLKSLGL